MVTKNEALLDAKIDMKDGSRELCYLRNWIKCHVRIEAIECFPCYIKVSFFYSDDPTREYPIAVVRINIPGIRVEAAASRTKAVAYGVFWKNNRKRCKMFFAFDQKENRDTHMKWFRESIESLENYQKRVLKSHKINRNVETISKLSSEPSKTDYSLSTEYQDLDENIQSARNLQDVLGPLPAIPNTADNSTRWSFRRISGYYGIYEEIMEPTQKDIELKNSSRDSVTSGIYVDMKTPLKENTNECTEIPPPLPPRRRYKNHTSTQHTVDAANDNRKTTWYIANNYTYNQATGCGSISMKMIKDSISDSNTVTENPRSITKTRSVSTNLKFMSTKQNSFSTPDLTNMMNTDSVNVKTSPNTNDLDDIDLDVMDIERSNSLNTSTNQFINRPLALNISSNILWSHNLSSTLSSNCDPSAINLVGANVNDDKFLKEDLSGYCQMAPIVCHTSEDTKKEEIDGFRKTRTSTRNQIIEDVSGYCAMAPITSKKADRSPTPKSAVDCNIDAEASTNDPALDQTDRSNDDSVSYLDFSLLSSNQHSSNRMSNEENSSSGVSSDEGAAYTNFSSLSMSSCSIENVTKTDRDSFEDDAVSLTCTESSMNSPTIVPHDIIFSTKFDEKYPSYYPNNSIKTNYCDSNKYTVNNGASKAVYGSIKATANNENKCSLHSSETPTTPVNRMEVLTPVKVETTKLPKESASNFSPREKSDGEKLSNEKFNVTHDNIKLVKNSENSKFKENTLKNHVKQTFDSKKVLTETVVKAETPPSSPTIKSAKIQNRFVRNTRISTAAASPRRIYHKCATLATRFKPQPPIASFYQVESKQNTQIPQFSSKNNEENNTVDGVKSNVDATGGIMRFAALSRLKKIDLSPLRLKITSILQRPQSEF